MRHAGPVYRRPDDGEGARAGDRRLAAADPRAADPVHAGNLLVPGRAGCVRTRSRPAYRFPAHALVLPDADLLPRDANAGSRDGDLVQKSDIYPGADVSRDFSGRPEPGRAHTRQILGAVA